MAIKWLLFIAMSLTLPVPYFMIVIGGLLPLAAIVYVSLTIPFGLVHLAVYGPIFYVISSKLSRWLMRLPGLSRTIAFAGI